MPLVCPFRAVRYDPAHAGSLTSVIAPPYDVISPEQRDQLAARSPNNIVHLILEKERPGDGPEDNKYLRAAKHWNDWREKGVLRTDPRPALYGLEQTFAAPDGRQLVRRGVLGALKLHDFSEGVVVPHEKTLAGPKADRLELFKKVKANLSPIFGLYQDDRNEASAALARTMKGDPTAEADSDDAVHHRLWRIEDAEAIAAWQKVVADRRIFIADGHHRYETALAYRKYLDAQTPGLPADGGHQFVLAFLCAMSDPGLVIFPTHRLLFGLKNFQASEFCRVLDAFFEIQTLPEDIRKPAGRAWAVSKLAEHGGKSTTFLMVTAEDQKARIITLRDDAALTNASMPKNETVRALDVSILHGLVFQHLLGLSTKSQENQENLKYVKDAGEAVNRVLGGECQVGFLLNPTPMWQVRAVGEAGETMPQKSTFFFPKLASGLVMRPIDPGERLT
jgi:uncharacterized protein (DUF1015 family)